MIQSVPIRKTTTAKIKYFSGLTYYYNNMTFDELLSIEKIRADRIIILLSISIIYERLYAELANKFVSD